MERQSTSAFISGSMLGGKSEALIHAITAAKLLGMKVLAYKSTKDTRDGLLIKSRALKDVIPALAWNEEDSNRFDIFNITTDYMNSGMGFIKPKAVFFDEAHFLSVNDMKFIVNACKRKNIPLYMSGLLTDFKQDEFPSTKWLKENCTDFLFFNGRCHCCNKEEAVHNVRLDRDGKLIKEGEVFVAGDTELYNVLCPDCFEEMSK